MLRLLTHQSSNAKLSKNDKVNSEWETWILYLAPANIVADVNLCPGASAGCRKACLYTAGRGQMSSVQAGRIRKTELLRDHPEVFMSTLVEELARIEKRQARTGKRQAIRLNGTSDIAWEHIAVEHKGKRFDSVFTAFPTLQFYDYTKLANRALAQAHDITYPSNYSLTFSRSEANQTIARRLTSNVAVVFQDALPAQWEGRRVIDGTAHDMRFLDPYGVVIGLLAKGKAKQDKSGFVYTEQRA